MKLLITGAQGMLGRTLMHRWADLRPAGIDVDDCDITRAIQVQSLVQEARPDVIVHCAAMTAVDRCETEVDRAWSVNAIGSANVATAAHRTGARLIAISTDYVFSGELDRPYHEWDAVGPRTEYGRSKLAGETAIRTHCPDHVIARTAWLYGPGGPSFVHTMLRLGREAGPPLKVVDDQIGNPTSTLALADGLRSLFDAPVCGTFHLSCEGEATWYEFAREIFTRCGIAREITPCTTAEFPRPAPRPQNSRLEKRALQLHALPPMADWRAALDRFVEAGHATRQES